ncbi:MAG: metal-sulfur cluster assembly factor [Candidatus Aenigmarchaeota archaeon]|nr:metal-sulfur cluster assembly factor [Candidatus Aenigmarchaeota archaeon]
MKKAAEKVSKSPAAKKNASAITKESVLKVLKNVIDPEIGMDIVDLGFIYGVDVKGKDVHVRMTLTNPGCPMHSMFTHEVESALKMAFGDVKVNVELVFDPPWTPERMTQDARKKLGIK